MKITILYDNSSFRKDLKSDWGFSALIETGERKILFDTGASGSILQENMEKMDITPKTIDDVFISHSHFDHTGGLLFVLHTIPNVKVWVPYMFPEIKGVDSVVRVKDPIRMYKGVYSTGTIDHIEQSLCVDTTRGIVIVVGCAHPNLANILKRASKFGELYGIIGGMHSNRPDSLKGLKLICPLHCTKYLSQIKKIYPDQYLEGGAGKTIEI